MSGGALGLQNTVLSCFAGVALQLLSHAEPFLLWVMSLSEPFLQRCPILGALRNLEDGLSKALTLGPSWAHVQDRKFEAFTRSRCGNQAELVVLTLQTSTTF